MSIPKIVISGDMTMYVGHAEDSTVLTRISATHTGGKRFRLRTPKRFEASLGRSIQSGWQSVHFDVGFLDLDDIVLKMQNGQDLDDPEPWTTTGFKQYSLLFLHPNEDDKLSVWMPVVEVGKESQPEQDDAIEAELNYDKKAPTVAEIPFVWRVRNIHLIPGYIGTHAYLKSEYLSTRSPY